jgi:hypothetical protein
MTYAIANRATRILGLTALTLASVPAFALQFDWSGDFRSELNYIHNYELNSDDAHAPTQTPANAGNPGYTITGGGSRNANFENLFLRAKPKVTVNDNVYIYSEWWLGDPVFGMFGNAVPYTVDQRQYYSTQSRGSIITAQRFWGEFDSDIGVFEVGRAPLDWGLGIVWNRGDGSWRRTSLHGTDDRRVGYGRPWDRYESTGDLIRLVSKFGSFQFSPAFILYTTGNNIGGACTFTGPACNPIAGGGGVADYSISLKYENVDEDMEGGVNFIHRVGQSAQDAFLGPPFNSPVGISYTTWDLYGKKKLGKFTLGGEVPIVNGSLGPTTYSTWAFAAEADWKVSDTWDTSFRVGHAPGQEGSATNQTTDFKAYTFNPNYRLGLIMFNYQFANFHGPNTQNNPQGTALATAAGVQPLSPYDNPITNANYLTAGMAYHTDKWDFHTNWIFARANQMAKAASAFNWNDWTRKYDQNGAGKDQGASLGWEMDWGTAFQWDDNLQFGLDFGLFFPGSYFAYSNTPVDNPTNTAYALVARVGVAF